MTSPVENKVYLHDDAYVHTEDAWIEMGARMAAKMEITMRNFAQANGDATAWEGLLKPVCPACYMLIAYNSLVMMAQRNGQSLNELRSSMMELFRNMDVNNPTQTSLKVMCDVPQRFEAPHWGNLPDGFDDPELNTNDCEEETG